ncbi:MAG: TonB-dependent receptor [Myxococcota bacterium]|nr:TonB-dependent receptor [Myxococcota bacterium]
MPISSKGEEISELPHVSEGRLEEIVVTATRYPKQLDSIPAYVSVITADEISNSMARTIPDLLRTEVGLHVTDITGNRASYTVDIRGFGETAALNTLVLVDGRRINSADLSGTDWTTIPLDRVDRIEVVRGARSSVIYGDNASGGVINILTRQGQEFQAGLAVDVGSYGTLDTAGYVRGSEGDLTYAFSGSRQHSEGYRENSLTQFDSVGVDLGYFPTAGVGLRLSGGYTSNDARLPGAIKASEFAAGVSRTDSLKPDDFSDVEDFYVKGAAEIALEANVQFKMDASYRKRDSSAFSTFFGGNFEGDTTLETVIASPMIIVDHDVLGMKNHLTFGFDYESNQEEIVNLLNLTGPPNFSSVTGYELEKWDYGYFVYEEIAPFRGALLSAGYRYDKANFSYGGAAQGDTSLDENIYTLGWTQDFGEELDVYFSFSRGFRYPVLDELFNFISNSINSDLRAQISQDYEMGLRYQADNRSGLRINFFQIDTDHEIFLDPEFFTNTNLDGKTRRRGLEFSIFAGIKNLDVSVGYAYTKADIIGGSYSGKEVPGVPAHQVTLSGLIELGGGVSVAVDGKYVGSRPFISDFENAFPFQESYFVMNAKLKYEKNWFSVFVDLNNLTNAVYSEYGVLGGFPTEQAYYPSPEFNFLVGVAVNF